MRIAEGSSIKREIVVGGLSKPVQSEITADGISFWIKGSRKRVHVGWKQIIQAGHTGTDVPAFLMNKPIELLQHQIVKARSAGAKP
jgi:hypothetical protein